MDTDHWEKIELEKLERVRARLNDEQRQRLQMHADTLREQEIYGAKHERAIAEVIYENRHPNHQRSDINSIYDRAESEARERDLKEQQKAQQAAHEKREKEARDAEAAKPREIELQAVAASFDRRHGQANYGSLPQASTLPQQRNPNQPLSANEVLQRFGNPELEAQYQRQENQRQQQAKSSLLTPSEISSSAGRGNTGDAQKASGLMSDFVKQETKRKAEEERAFDAAKAQVFGRGGRGR
jgi:hypothetical protein